MSERGSPASTITDTLRLKFATAVTETTAPRTQRLRALRRAGVLGGREGNWGMENRGVSGVIIGSVDSSFLLLELEPEVEDFSDSGGVCGGCG